MHTAIPHPTEGQIDFDIAESLSLLPEYSRKLLRVVENPFLNLDWFEVFSEHVAPALGRQIWLSLLSSSGNTAVLPLISFSEGRLIVLKCMANYYSPYFEIPIVAEADEDIAKQFLALAKHQFSNYDIVRVCPLTQKSEEATSRLFRSLGYMVHTYHHSANWRQTKIVDFNSYWDSRCSRLKSTIMRKAKKLDQCEHAFRIYTSHVDSEVVSDYEAVYRRSWKKPEPFPKFIHALLYQMSKTGALRLGILYIGGRPAASQLWIVANNTAYIYKLAYDPAFQIFSPGSLLSHHLFRHVIETDRVETIDYLTGDDPYKADWVDSRRQLMGLEICRPTHIRGSSVVAYSKFRNQVRQCLQLGKNALYQAYLKQGR